jgi:glutamate formiminotransferase/formiminotetrahydrofolate cyclodeaminase
MAAYDAIVAARRMPKTTEAEKAVRAAEMRKVARQSIQGVEDVLADAVEIITVSRRLADIANPNLVSDVGVASELALGAARAAQINVAVNLAGYVDAAHAAEVRERTDAAVATAERVAAETRAIVIARLAT